MTLLIPTEIDQLALANTFRENNIFINANKETKHGLSYSFSNPIFNADSFDYKPIFQNNTFKVYEKPDDQQITINGTYFAQQINDSYFYWKRSAHIIHPTIQSTAKDIMQKFRSKYPHEPLCLDIDDLTFYKNFESANKNDIALINPFASSNYIVRQNQLPNSLKREAESLCFTENAKEEFILKNSRYSIFKTITNHEHVNDTTKTANKFFLKLKTHYGAEKKVVLHPNVPEKLRLILTSIAKVHDFQITDIPDNSSLFINLVPSKQNDDSLNLISEKVDNTSSLIAYKPADHQSAYTNRIYDYKISIIGNYKKKYLNLYFKNGPSIDYESYTVFIANSVKNELISQPIDNNVAGISVPIPTYDQAIEFYVSVRHKTPHLILPYSEDILSVCLTKVVITDKILDERNDLILLSLIQLANAEHHKYTNFQTLLKHLYFNFYNINYASAIIDDNLTAIGTWNPIELYAGEPFRLSSKENIIRLNPKNYKRILFDLEASYPTKQCAVYFSINGQISTKTTTLSARSKIYLDLPINRLGDDEEISISFFTDPNTAFRIFKIKPE